MTEPTPARVLLDKIRDANPQPTRAAQDTTLKPITVIEPRYPDSGPTRLFLNGLEITGVKSLQLDSLYLPGGDLETTLTVAFSGNPVRVIEGLETDPD